MKHQKQRNRWSCLLASFAMMLDTTQEELIEEIGHDGSEIIFPDAPFPYNHRSFCPEEFVLPCLQRGRYFFTIHNDVSINTPGVAAEHHISFNKILQKVVARRNGILLGVGAAKTYHAVAWYNFKIYDPNGTVADFEDFTPDIFLAFNLT